MKYLSNFKAWMASDGSIFDYESECEEHEAFISKMLASEEQPNGDENPISAVYNEMLAEYEEIRVNDSFRKGFKYAMSFLEKALKNPEEPHYFRVDVFDGESYI